MSAPRALFLDRDGTINVDLIGNYVVKPEEFRLIPGVAEALKLARAAGFKLAIITNQQCIAKDLVTTEGMHNIHRKMEELIAKELGEREFYFDSIQFCPHFARDNCGCRKPAPGMVDRAVKEMGAVDFARSYFLGDKTSDLFCGKHFGMKTVLLETGWGKETLKELAAEPKVKPYLTAADLLFAVQKIISSS